MITAPGVYCASGHDKPAVWDLIDIIWFNIKQDMLDNYNEFHIEVYFKAFLITY